MKFRWRHIQHEWIVESVTIREEWYKGNVLRVLSENDIDIDAVYEVQNEGEEEPYEFDHSVQDYL